ncbi:MAG: hypothetical protein AAFV07_19805, partial [Bacteroidota bacterium]
MRILFPLTISLLAGLFSLCFAQTPVSVFVSEPAGINRSEEPVTLGIPFEKGALNTLDNLGIQSVSGQDIPAQFDVMARWRDGSIRWVKTNFQTDVQASQIATYRLIRNSNFSHTSPLSVV